MFTLCLLGTLLHGKHLLHQIFQRSITLSAFYPCHLCVQILMLKTFIVLSCLKCCKRSIRLFSLSSKFHIFWREIIMLNRENYLDSLFQARLMQFSSLLVLLRPLNFHISSGNMSFIKVTQLWIWSYVQL